MSNAGARRREVAERLADLRAWLDPLSPDTAVCDRARREVVVGPGTVVITPRRRAEALRPQGDRPRRPKRERETARGPDGRFVRGATTRAPLSPFDALLEAGFAVVTEEPL